MCCAQILDSPPIHSLPVGGGDKEGEIHSQQPCPLNPPVGLTEVVGEDEELTRNEAYCDILFKSDPADESRV
jgi:hypothetical protein